MTDFLFQFGVSNVLLSVVLALAAMTVGAAAKRPRLAHLLWLLVLVKLVTPPVFTIPVDTNPERTETGIVAMKEYSQRELTSIPNSVEKWYAIVDYRKKELSLAWLIGSLFVFSLSLTRIYRFNRLLYECSEDAPSELQTTAAGISERLGMKKAPDIYKTSANLQPMVWWFGGKVRIIIPDVLYSRMDPGQFRLILAHELAHVRRRDYMVRWIEWLACVCFWWNPVVWWARHSLRTNEELCCDALVITGMKLKAKIYADSILKAVEYLACPVYRPPAMASEINSGGFLVKRIKMIVSDKLYKSNPLWLQAFVLFCALSALSLSFVCRVDSAVDEMSQQSLQARLTAADPSGTSKIERYQKEIQEKLQFLIDTGKINKEEAALKTAYFEKQLLKRMNPGENNKEGITEEQYRQQKFKQFLTTLEEAVGEGKLTEEQAKSKMAGFERKLPEKNNFGEQPEQERKRINDRQY